MPDDMALISNAERLARAVLLFYEPGPWDERKAELWRALTGTDEATTRVLGNLARDVRAKEERKAAIRSESTGPQAPSKR
jgi:hypothetical protein